MEGETAIRIGTWPALGRAVLDWIYPGKCALCGLLRASSPCEVCVSEMVVARPNFLSEPKESALQYRACIYSYSGRAAQSVRKLKYARSTSLSAFMSHQVGQRISEVLEADAWIVPVPLHRSRRAWRGFNQAEICASSSGERKSMPHLLKRIRATRPQAGLSLKEREANLFGAFRGSPGVAGRHIVLVDDVVTSGHTARECSRVLRECGALSVGIVAFCGNLD